MSRDIITMDLDVAEASMDMVLDYIKDMGGSAIDEVAKDVLPKLGKELAGMIHRDGPRAARHRGPGKNGNQKWRSEYKHAVDTVKPSRVYRDKESGALMVKVGPGRGDNTPSFYLKFLEYGWLENKGSPFLRPARRIIMDQRAVPLTVAAMNRLIKRRRPRA